MTTIFLYGSLTLGLASLAAGWALAGHLVVGLALLALIPLVLFLVRRKFHAIIGLSLVLTAISGAVGLWTGVHLSFALMALVGVLAAWDLDGFSRRLVFAADEDDPGRQERQHLMQLNLVLLIGVGINLLSQTIHYKFGFEWAFLLAILAFYGVGALISGLQSKE